MDIRTREDADVALQLLPATGGMSDGMVQLLANVHMLQVAGKPSGGLLPAVRRIYGSFGTLLTIVERHEWQKQQGKAGALDHMAWMFFAGCDVEHFYVSLRTVFDDIAFLCSRMATKKGECPDTFGKLLQWCTTEQRADRVLGSPLASAIRACTWFESTRLTRDAIVHLGALTLALPGPETVSFQVHAGANSSVVRPELMSNENLADFELFMAWILGNLVVLLDQIGRLALTSLTIEFPVQATFGRGAIAIAREYLVRLRQRLPVGSGGQPQSALCDVGA
jgi:hypothetical protein